MSRWRRLEELERRLESGTLTTAELREALAWWAAHCRRLQGPGRKGAERLRRRLEAALRRRGS